VVGISRFFCALVKTIKSRNKKQLTRASMPDILAGRVSGGACGWTLKIEQCEQDGTLIPLEMEFKEADRQVIKSQMSSQDFT
jgi:hypothetical protein